MTPREFRQEQEFEFDHFQELTSTGIKPNYVNIELFAHEYHKRKLKLLGIADVVVPKGTCCEPVGEGFYLGTSCPKCKKPFRQNLK
jgi:hypothetical protein